MAADDTNSGVSFFKIVFLCSGSIGGGPPSLSAADINKQEQYSQTRTLKSKSK